MIWNCAVLNLTHFKIICSAAKSIQSKTFDNYLYERELQVQARHVYIGLLPECSVINYGVVQYVRKMVMMKIIPYRFSLFRSYNIIISSSRVCVCKKMSTNCCISSSKYKVIKNGQVLVLNGCVAFEAHTLPSQDTGWCAWTHSLITWF